MCDCKGLAAYGRGFLPTAETVTWGVHLICCLCRVVKQCQLWPYCSPCPPQPPTPPPPAAPAIKDLQLDLAQWQPIIEDRAFVPWLVKHPGDQELRKARRLTPEQVGEAGRGACLPSCMFHAMDHGNNLAAASMPVLLNSAAIQPAVRSWASLHVKQQAGQSAVSVVTCTTTGPQPVLAVSANALLTAPVLPLCCPHADRQAGGDVEAQA